MKLWIIGFVLLVITITAAVRYQSHKADHEFREANKMLDNALKLPTRK